ncbi:SusC/RagA family TonB-linked outer membrane protein [Sediminitomix flava]|uniref:TonB-linked SusC/RagA family outer membrane protein n=1 Tax=Sediminitomix flava TaxID=379075 RepID=A0A315Z9F8_SEDFL|nr:SusC/RagA family TonB-linked outer membrane protein [Sediminitomix flava]PWJ42186.1 TonB-linked SusC/RagA family outer membrane protein [Sediminitomix flava]
MRNTLFWLFSMSMLMLNTAYAQERTVKGVVTDASDKSPLPGVNVIIKGSASGTVTNFDGEYEISIDSDASVLTFSSIGYKSIDKVVGNASTINLALEVDAEELEEVVVTALGIERDKRSLGYATTEVGADEIGSAGVSSNMMNSLSGKVAGVQIAPVGGGAGSSSRVVIRGAALLGQSNQPLYVIDGVPMTNESVKDAGGSSDSGDVSTGDGLSSINPDDIESMSVLKGGAATALYGSRAINGVILITTKSGQKGEKLGIDFSTGVNFDMVGITPNDQKRYGQGTLGALPSNPKAQTSMWGPRITGQENNAYYDGQTRNLKAYDNYNDFYNTGVTFNTNVALTGGTENSSIRFSYNNLDSDGMVDNSTFKRNSFNLRSKTSLMNDKLKLDSRVTYTNQKAHNRMEMGNSVHNYAGMLLGIPTTNNVNWLKDYKNPDGTARGYNDKESNPYWTMNEVVNEDELNRILGMVSLTYEFTDYLKLMGRAGTDFNSFRQNTLQPMYTPWFEQGRAFEMTNLSREDNYDFLLMFNKKFGDFDINANAGGSYMKNTVNYSENGSIGFTSPNFQNPIAGRDRFLDYKTFESAISSFYATASIGYKGYLFLDVSARNDWSSTLPMDNNSFFYPSVSGSWVFSDMDWKMPDWLSFGKLRASWAQVGSATDPYMLALQYNFDGQNHNGINVGGIEGNVIPNRNLKPSIQTSHEIGLDLRMFNNRVGVDVAYYKSSATDQILAVDVSQGSGYSQAMINAGQIDNQGWEVMLNVVPVQTDNFTWDMTFNASYNDNQVVSLSEGVDQYNLFSQGDVSIQARPGEAYGVIVGSKYLRDDAGNIVVDSEGRPQKEDGVHEIGQGVQPWMAGLRNTFKYKNFSLSFLIDSKWGGQIYSNTEAAMYSSGKHEATLVGRDEYYSTGHWNPGGLVNADGTAFTGSVDPELYYGAMSGISEQFIYDASFIKLREVSITYMMPHKFIQKTPFRNLAVSATGFNLGYLWRKTDNIDPESTFTNGNAQGIEMSNMSIPRSFGFKLNANF